MKIAGVTRDEVKLELLEFMLEEDLPSLSQAVDLALEQWFEDRRRRRSSSASDGVLHPAASVQNPYSTTEGRE